MVKKDLVKPISIFAAAFLATACGALPVAYTTSDLEETSYETAWNATLEVLRSRFPIAETSREEGLIVTSYKSRPAEASRSQHRWKAEARLSEHGRSVALRLRVTKERLESQAAFEALSSASYEQPSFAQESEYGRGYGTQPYGIEPVWTEVGRDRQMERELIEEIKARLKTD